MLAAAIGLLRRPRVHGAPSRGGDSDQADRAFNPHRAVAAFEHWSVAAHGGPGPDWES